MLASIGASAPDQEKVRRVEIIVNRTAGRLARPSPLLAVFESARERGARVHETRSIAELDEIAREIASRGADCVVLAGGDGSYMAGVTALHRAMGDEMPVVALAPGGTASTVARNWGLRGSSVRDAAKVIEAAFAGARAIERPTLRVTDAERREHVGFIFGAGLVANFFDVYYASPHQGYAGAARIVARVFAGSFSQGSLARRVLEPVPATLSIDGHAQSSSAFSLVVASVVKDLGIGMRPAYRAGERFDRVHVVASPLAPRALGPQMPRVLLGRPLAGEGNVDALAAQIDLTFTSERDAYVLDGEILRARSVRVAPGPVIRVL
jgi:diacylglycerol kinase family enzyme